MMSRPKILLCVDWYLPGYRAGGPIRSCANLIAHLGHELDFYVLCGDRDYQSDSPYEGVLRATWCEGTMGEQVMYVDPSAMRPAFVRTVMLEGNFDHVYIQGLFSNRFAITPLRVAKKLGIAVTLAPRGMLRESALAIKRKKKSLFLSMAKANGLYKGVQFHATDAQEQLDIVTKISKKASVMVAPNLARKLPQTPSPIVKKRRELNLIFAGRVAKEKNLAFAIEVLKLVDSVKINLDVYGAVYDQEYMKHCLKLQQQLPPHIKLSFFEPIPSEEVPALLLAYHALFLPTRGENFGHIILESFMAARPVIISDQTPWLQLADAGVGYALPLSQKGLFVEAIEAMGNMEQEAYNRMSTQSYNKAKEFCQDEGLIAASKALFLPS